MSYSDDYVSVDLAITFVILDTLNIFLIDWLIDWLVLICHCYCIHCTACNKINTLLCRYMTQKLFAFAKGKCCAESCDNPMFQEVLLAGHLYQNVLKVHRCCVIDSCDFVFLVAFSNCSSDTFCCRLIVVTFGFCRAMLCIIAAYASCGVCMCVCHVCGSCQNE